MALLGGTKEGNTAQRKSAVSFRFAVAGWLCFKKGSKTEATFPGGL